jgi:hypothetical protein
MSTACTKLHWFQFRINHNILATNYFLKKIKIIDDANCNICQKENETIHAPTLIIVGEVVKLREKLNWFDA